MGLTIDYGIYVPLFALSIDSAAPFYRMELYL